MASCALLRWPCARLLWRSQVEGRREKGDQPWVLYYTTRRRGGMRNALISRCGRSPRGVIKKSVVSLNCCDG